jgi:hypothetical protein
MIFRSHQLNEAICYLTGLFEKGKPVKIEPAPEKKSLSQNAYLWLVFTHVGYETGARKDDMYYYWLGKFPKYKEVYFKGELKLVPISLSSFSKEQTSRFIDEVVTDARIEGFQVPDPEDIKIMQMYEFYRNKGLI